MTCPKCGIEMVVQTATDRMTLWKCINGHRHISRSDSRRPHPHNLERK